MQDFQASFTAKGSAVFGGKREHDDLVIAVALAVWWARVAVCYVGSLNINEQMVVDGWALAYRRYSMDYVRAEKFAKSRREGMWRGEFVPPWEWRQSR